MLSPSPRLIHLRSFAVLYIVALTLLIQPANRTHATEVVNAANRAPNLLIIQTDEHNFRTLGCYRETLSPEQALMWGKSIVETPNIDWIASKGALCTSFYATTPVCSPSRGSLITGQYPQHTPVTTNNIPLSDDVITFAELLKRQGYATGFAGKWHLDGAGKPQWAPKRKFGFEDNRFMFNRGHWKNFVDSETGPKIGPTNNSGAPTYAVDDADEKSFATDWLANKAIDFINEHQAEPFCYYVSFPDPHGPDTVRAPYDTMYENQVYDKPRTGDQDAETSPKWGLPQQGGFNQAKYYGMVRCIDDNIGKLIETLKSNGILENTIIVFTSDHGDLRGEHHRQNKGIPYEASARVPFLIYHAGHIKPGLVIDEALTCVDFQPTVLEMMGVKGSGQEDGRDATQLFLPNETKEDWNDIAFVRGTGDQQGWLMAVTDRYKLVYSHVDQPWLFDLERDPDELNNFFGHPGYRETIQTMSSALKKYGQTYDDPYITSGRVKSDLEWGINGTGEYQAPAKQNARARQNKKTKANARKNKS